MEVNEDNLNEKKWRLFQLRYRTLVTCLPLMFGRDSKIGQRVKKILVKTREKLLGVISLEVVDMGKLESA